MAAGSALLFLPPAFGVGTLREDASACSRKSANAFSLRSLKGSSLLQKYSNSPATFADSEARRNLPRSVMNCCSSATVTGQPRFHFGHETGEQVVQLTSWRGWGELRLVLPHLRRLANERLERM